MYCNCFKISFMWNYSNPMNLNFFFRFQLSILNLLEMKLCKFFYLFFYEVIPSHDLGDKFNRLIHANLSCFFIFFFSISSFLSLCWLENRASYFICFCFLWGYIDLMTQVAGMTSWLELAPFIFLDAFLIEYFFLIGLHSFFFVFFIWGYLNLADSSRKFDRLTQDDLIH
jgi:hypothetical protein